VTWIAVLASLLMAVAAVCVFIFAVKKNYFRNIEDAKYQVFWSDLEEEPAPARAGRTGDLLHGMSAPTQIPARTALTTLRELARAGLRATDVTIHPGMGISGVVDGVRYFAGNGGIVDALAPVVGRTLLLSGDCNAATESTAAAIGADAWNAEATPVSQGRDRPRSAAARRCGGDDRRRRQ